MKRARTFIAIDPGKKIRDRLVSLQESLMEEGADAKWVEEENLHLTLLFLGEVDLIKVPSVCKEVEKCVEQHGAFPMTIEKTGCFPNPRRPRVLWAGVGLGNTEICEIHDELEEPLMDLGCYRREERKYQPHLTIGRIKGDRSRSSGDLTPVLNKFADWQGGEITVKEIHVMSSELTPSGPKYTVMSRAKLA